MPELCLAYPQAPFYSMRLLGIQRGHRSTPTPIVSLTTSSQAQKRLYVQAKDMFRFNLRKFLTNSRERIDCAESLDETYEATLGCSPTEENKDEEATARMFTRVEEIGVLCCLIFDVSELAQLATRLQPTKRSLIGFTTHWAVKFIQKLC